ncbi:uncharacterized protein METZ01_LOCUS148404 [marine metagenome]|uniref:Uncharacterized protein n=1 Tax=marine metagenome TaxID=408172 RepID=A0A382A210_9ZZZZ
MSTTKSMQRARARKQKIYQKMKFQQQPESTWNPAVFSTLICI